MSVEAQFKNLVEIVAQLRGPNGCPWDQEQTQLSLCQYILEEAYELVEAIESRDQGAIKEELGDFLFQVILQAQVAKDNKDFEITQVIEAINEKMIRRHPHVFSQTGERSLDEIWKNWHRLKGEENKGKPKPVFNYPQNMPALQAAAKIGVKSKAYAFDWTRIEDVFAKIQEEIEETRIALNDYLKPKSQEKSKQELEHEIGDVLFSVAQLARHAGLDPEQSLRKANKRFETRFNKVLELAGLSREDFAALADAQKEEFWQQAKDQEKGL